MITGLDHVALVVRDLGAAVDGYRRLLGVSPEWEAADGGARHAWFQFPNMALDVISPAGEGAFGDRMRAHLDNHGEGIWALAFTAAELEVFAGLMARRGVGATAPSLTRSTRADGAKRYWQSSTLTAADTGGLQILLIAPPRDGPFPLSPRTGEGAIRALDHVVVQSPSAQAALSLYGAKLGLDLRLDRTFVERGHRLLFFKAGEAVIEIGAPLVDVAGADRFGGLAWRVADPHAARARIAAAGFDVSEVRSGRKPGTHVFTVRDAPAGVPTILLSAEEG